MVLDKKSPSLHTSYRTNERSASRRRYGKRKQAFNVARSSMSGDMKPSDALRFLDHEALSCREHDAHEALCLLLPALLKVMELPPMDDFEALAFRIELRNALVNASSLSQGA
jgi:hypothetical protein